MVNQTVSCAQLCTSSLLPPSSHLRRRRRLLQLIVLCSSSSSLLTTTTSSTSESFVFFLFQIRSQWNAQAMPSAVVSNASSLASSCSPTRRGHQRVLRFVDVSSASFVSSWSPAGPPCRRGHQRVLTFVDDSSASPLRRRLQRVLRVVVVSSASSASSTSPTRPQLRRHLQRVLRVIVVSNPSSASSTSPAPSPTRPIRSRWSQFFFAIAIAVLASFWRRLQRILRFVVTSGSLQLVSRALGRVRLLATPVVVFVSAPTCHLASSAPLLWSTQRSRWTSNVYPPRLKSSCPSTNSFAFVTSAPSSSPFPNNFFPVFTSPTTSLECARRIHPLYLNPPSARCRFRWS